MSDGRTRRGDGEVVDWRVGLFFHTFDKDANGNRIINQQGKIISKVGDGAFRVVRFSWLSGDPLPAVVEPEAYLQDAKFYKTDTDMIAECARLKGGAT